MTVNEKKVEDVTGRDGLLIAQALIAAIEMDARLPRREQAASNARDMKDLFDAKCRDGLGEKLTGIMIADTRRKLDLLAGKRPA